MRLSAIDENGSPVDWWFMYKVAGKSKTAAGGSVPGTPGTEYVYFDSNAPSSARLALSVHRVDKDGALPNSLRQLYGEVGASTQHLGWFFYNDENPINGTVNSARGHSKGVLAFDLATDTAFWLIQSTPKFPPQGEYAFPATGMPNAQTLLCVTLQDATTARQIAAQMHAAQQPNVYLASEVPADLVNERSDPRVLLMQDEVAAGTTPVTAVIPFSSKGGVKFMSIAKNKYWGLDFYNDLVGPALYDNLDVETWGHAAKPPSIDSDKIHTVVDMAGINLNPLGYDITWPEPDDHAKLAISARSETDHYICVGDMNFTVPMRKRSGGTVAFQCEPLWTCVSQCLVDVTTHLKPGSKAFQLQAAAQAAKVRAAGNNAAPWTRVAIAAAMKAIDTSAKTTGKGQQIKAKGYDAVGVYLRADRCSIAMIADLHQAGLKIWSGYEKGFPDHDDYFTQERGTTDGTNAAAFAAKMGQPAGTQIYATVDYNPDEHDSTGPTINGRISAYMAAFQVAVKAKGYLASVYSSGRVCRILIANGLAQTGWLSVSSSFAEHEDFKPHASIVQVSVIDNDWDGDTIADAGKPGLW